MTYFYSIIYQNILFSILVPRHVCVSANAVSGALRNSWNSSTEMPTSWPLYMEKTFAGLRKKLSHCWCEIFLGNIDSDKMNRCFTINKKHFSYTYYWYHLHTGSLFWIMCVTFCCFLASWWLLGPLEYYRFTFLAVRTANFFLMGRYCLIAI